MLKLTKAYYDEGQIKMRGFMWVAPAHIQMLESTCVADGVMMTEVCVQNRSRTVVESPEEIMAMPEMQMHLNPAFVLNPGPGPSYLNLREPMVFTR